MAIGIYLLWRFRESFSNFNITISCKDENTSKSILRVMYGMYKGSHFMGKGFGVWLSVRTLRKPAVRKFFFLPFVPLSVTHCSPNPVARPEEWMGKDKYLDSLEWIRRSIVSKGGVCLCTVYKINWSLHVFLEIISIKPLCVPFSILEAKTVLYYSFFPLYFAGFNYLKYFSWTMSFLHIHLTVKFEPRLLVFCSEAVEKFS